MNRYCEICGDRPAKEVHHLLYGTSERKICDRYDFLKLSLCRECHDNIHKNGTAGKLSKMLGQALFEANFTYEEYMNLFKMNYLP